MPLAVRLGRAALSSLRRATNLPTITSFTVSGVSRINTNKGSGVSQPIFCSALTVGTTFDVLLYWDQPTVAGSMAIASVNAAGQFTAFASRPASGAWFEWYIRCSGTGANLLAAGWRNLGASSWVTATTTLDTGATMGTMILGGDGSGTTFSDISYASYREYNRVLTTPEIELEHVYATPFNTGGLTSALAFPSPADLVAFDRKAFAATRWRDYSGNGGTWTESAGAFELETITPPIQFAPTRFRRRVRRTRPAAGGGTNVASGVGALTVAGFAPTVAVSANQTVAAGVGVLTATGFAPTVAVPRNVQSGVGAATLTGFAPTASVSANVNVSTALGTATLTGFAPTIATPQGVTAGLGQLTLSGFAPTISTGGAQSVLPGTGVLSLSGFAPTIATPRNVQAGVGALSLTGFAPTVQAPRNVTSGLGQISLSGFAPTVAAAASVSILAGVGVIAVSGFAPTATVSVPPREESKWLLFHRGGKGFIRRSR